MFNPCRPCDRSHIHDVVYINSHQTVFHYVSHELLDGCRSCTLACLAGRLSLLLYSPAQDGKHIKCFPLRAELATNSTRASRPRRPSLPSLASKTLFLAASAARGPRSPRRGCLRLLLNFGLWLKEKREMRSASPVFVAPTLGQ